MDAHVTLIPLALVAQDSNEEGFGLQAGPYAFFLFVALGLSLVFLLFSMRKQMRRVRFDEHGNTDSERMLGATDKGPASAGEVEPKL